MLQLILTTDRADQPIAVAYAVGVGVDACSCSICLTDPHSAFECSCHLCMVPPGPQYMDGISCDGCRAVGVCRMYFDSHGAWILALCFECQ
jgi:hypothetical protein